MASTVAGLSLRRRANQVMNSVPATAGARNWIPTSLTVPMIREPHMTAAMKLKPITPETPPPRGAGT